MSDTTEAPAPKTPRDRSPSFPIISLKPALERLEKFEGRFGRHPAPYQKAGLAWGIKEGSSQTNQLLAALKSFGLIEYGGSGKDRTVAISDTGRTYLRAQQQSIKDGVIKKAALRPKAIALFWPDWKADRPIDAICLDKLVLEQGFNEKAAPSFLKVYDETIAFAGLSDSDIATDVADDDDEQNGEDGSSGSGSNKPPSHRPLTPPSPPPQPASVGREIAMIEGERVLASGMLSKSANYRVLVQGPVTQKDLKRLITKLELDLEILAEAETGDREVEN
ncbi:MAG: hypothetical protein SGJ21_09135 [Alphaproteobacteria bacterium]|nr:hypothetical protein [Alphaproteobacteria bacterium]